MSMQVHHFAMLAIVAFIFYLVGVKYPSTGSMLLSKVGM